MARLGPWRVSGFGPTRLLDEPVDHITNFRPVGWYWNGEIHDMSEQANTQDYPHPGELVAAALDAPPPEPAE
jgi:hypothetical protein